jgi:hypothetical protein
MEFLIILHLKSLTYCYHSRSLTYVGNVPFNESDIDYSLHHCWLPWQTRTTILVMAQYMWHAHPEANKQDWKPMQHITHIIVYLLVCYIFHTFTTLIFIKHTENEVSIFHKEICSTTVLAPNYCDIYPWDGTLAIYSELNNVELLAYINLAVCVILIHNLKKIHDDLANNPALPLEGLCRLVHLRDS